MHISRTLVVGLLIAAGLTMLPAGASASVPAASSCASLKTLNKKLEKVLSSKTYDSGAISDLAHSFKNGAKSAPKSLKSPMNTIASVASDAADAGSTNSAVSVLKKDTAKLVGATATWTKYLSTKCA
jgi:hypothetical protein